MKNAKKFITNDGSIGLYNEELDEIYHSKDGAQKESIEKFIIPSNFEQRTKSSNSIRLLDICYGIGYNSKNALCFWENCDIYIDAIEWDKELVEISPQIDFIEPKINEFLAGKRTLGNSKINFFIEDARKVVKSLAEPYDVIFLDAFAPNKLPTLWSVEFFCELKRLMKKDSILTTYCSAQSVRKAMDLAGFKLGKFLDDKNHSYVTVASLDESLILNPLDEYEIGLMNTKAGIPYRDKGLNHSANEIFELRETEFKNSKLIGASAYIRQNKNYSSM